jgi:integrase
MNFKQLGHAYVDALPERLCPSTRKSYKSEISIISRKLGDLSCLELQLADAIRVINESMDDNARLARSRAFMMARVLNYGGFELGDEIVSFIEGMRRSPKRNSISVSRRSFGSILNCLDSYQGFPNMMALFQTMPLLALPPGELLSLRSEDVDLEGRSLTIRKGAGRLTMDRIVPLSAQSVRILARFQRFTERDGIVFAANRGGSMSRDVLCNRFRDVKSADMRISPEDFPRFFAKFMTDRGWKRDPINEQTSLKGRHQGRLHLEERVRMMQEWADMCDQMKEDAK